MSLIRNNAVKRHVLDLSNCHCTVREMVPKSETKAIAYAMNEQGVVDYTDVRANISWVHRKKETVIFWHLKIGVSFYREFPCEATDGKIDEVITSGFVEMDEAWQTEET